MRWRSSIRQLIIIFFISLVVIFYVWQNIELVRKGLDYRKLANVERQLVQEKNRILFEIERYKTMQAAEAAAASKGFRSQRPEDMEVLVVR